jgi:predicted kinase
MNKDNKKIAIFTAGLPASGKSTYINNMLLKDKKYKNFVLIDSDKIKESLPDYDYTKPFLVHEKSKILAEVLFNDCIQKNKSIIIDSTLTDTKKYIQKIEYLKNLNYECQLIYCTVRLQTSLKRNLNNDRNRIVSNDIIIEKSKIIKKCFNIMKKYFNKITIIKND